MRLDKILRPALAHLVITTAFLNRHIEKPLFERHELLNAAILTVRHEQIAIVVQADLGGIT